MTKLAVYEKKYLKKDERLLNYFIEDYVYINNVKTRIGITLITLFYMMIGTFKIINVEILYPNSLLNFIEIYLGPYILPWLIVIIVYTIIATLVNTSKYNKASQRFNKYKRILQELEAYEAQQASSEGVTDEI